MTSNHNHHHNSTLQRTNKNRNNKTNNRPLLFRVSLSRVSLSVAIVLSVGSLLTKELPCSFRFNADGSGRRSGRNLETMDRKRTTTSSDDAVVVVVQEKKTMMNTEKGHDKYDFDFYNDNKKNNNKNNHTTKEALMGERDIHYSNVAVLPLLDWEEKSLQGIIEAAKVKASGTATTATASSSKQQQVKAVIENSCQPPNNDIPKQCCLGTFAGMGRIITDRRHYCSATDTINAMRYTLPDLVREELYAPSQQQQSQSQSQTQSQHDTNMDGCDVCRLLELLRRNRWNGVSFVGDSMTHQIYQGFICELYRRIYTVKELAPFKLFHNNNNRSDGNRRRQKDGRDNNSNTSDTAKVLLSKNINHGIHMIRTIEVSSPLWNTNNKTNNNNSAKNDDTNHNVITVRLFHVYRLPFENKLQQEMIFTSSDVIILNFGLHWGAAYGDSDDNDNDNDSSTNSTKYTATATGAGITTKRNPPTPRHLQTSITEFLQEAHYYNIQQQRQRDQRRIIQHVLFRETSSQHFDALDGDYSFIKKQEQKRKRQGKQEKQQQQQQQQQSSSLQCVLYNSNERSLENTSSSSSSSSSSSISGWREKVIRQAAINANYDPITITSSSYKDYKNDETTIQQQERRQRPKLKILPFADFTKPLYQLHPYEQLYNNDNGGSTTGNGTGNGDCTHYCSTPYLYMPLWRSIRLALLIPS